MIRKLRARHVRDMPLSHVDQMIAERRGMITHPGYATARASASTSAAASSNGDDAPSQALVAPQPVLAQVPMIPPASLQMAQEVLAPPRFACCNPATPSYTFQASGGLGFTHHAVIMQGDTKADGLRNPAQLQMAPLAPPAGSLLDGADELSGTAGQRPKMPYLCSGSDAHMGYQRLSTGYAQQMAPVQQPQVETLHSERCWQLGGPGEG